MSGALRNAMLRQALRAMSNKVVSAIGEITSYDYENFCVRVKLQPDGIMTGWLPLASSWIGNGWGMFAAPNIGDLIAVEFIDGDLEGGVAIARFYNDNMRPLEVQSGEFWLVHKNGQSVKLTNDGALTIDDGQGATVALDGAGNIVSQAKQWNHTGDMNIDGNVGVSKVLTAQEDVVGGSISLVTHPHGDVQTGSSETTPPLPSAPA
jgi:phage baseplate assembly protein V